MEVKPGYKQTEVGVIPEEWEVVYLSELTTAGPKNGYSGRSGRDARGTPTLSLNATSSGCLVLNDETVKRLDETIDPRSDLFLKAGDVLVQRSNTSELVGTTAVFNGPSGVYVYPDLMMRLRFKDEETAHWFWRYANSDKGRKYFVSIAAGSTGSMPKISGEKLRRMPLPAPPLSEQRAIAAALKGVDALLGALDQLITKKRDIKKAAMQQLLTGQSRLPGFSGEWEVRRLGDVATLHRENVIPAKSPKQLFVHFSLPAFDSGGTPVVELGLAIESNKFRVPSNAVLVSKLNPRIPRVWAPTDVPEQAVCSTEFLVLVPKAEVFRSFLYAVCSSPRFCEKMELAATGTTGSHQRMNPTEALKIQVLFPDSTDEQVAVATVLSDMNAEIAALEQRLAKTRALKQGMMQELLTGRTRLV